MLASALVSFEMRRFAPPDACYRPFQGSSLKHLESGGSKGSLAVTVHRIRPEVQPERWS